MNFNPILKIGDLYSTKTKTMLFDSAFNVIMIEQGKTLLLLNARYNAPEKFWVYDFFYDNKNLTACNHYVCDNISNYFIPFEEIITE